MKALVTGGGGFLGTHIIKLLLQEKFDVYNFSRNSYVDLTDMGVTCLKGDIRNPEDLALIDLSGFEVVFHVAAKAGVWGKKSDYFDINVTGTKNIYNKTKENKVPYFIYTSSPSAVFGWEDICAGDESLPYPESFSSYYGESKALAEQFILSQNSSDGPKTISLRPHLIWGPGDPHIFPRILDKAKQGKLKQVGEGDNLVDIIHVENAASAHIKAYLALKKNEELSGSVYFLGQSEPVNLWNFIGEILKRNKLDPIESSVSFKNAFRVGSLLEKLYRLLGIISPEPPMTKFMALQLGKSHYFSHKKAIDEIDYEEIVSTEEGLDNLYPNKG